MRLKDVMTKDVVCVSPQTTVAEALETMTRLRVSGLPVIDATGALVGVVSEADFMHRVELGTERPTSSWLGSLLMPGRAAEIYAHAHARRVEEIMSADVVTVDEAKSLCEAVAIMEKRGVKRLPVMREGQVVGMLTRADLVRTLASLFRDFHSRPLASDAEILQRIRGEMGSQPWAPTATIEVAVKDGVIGLRGSLTDERERIALRALVEGVEGVREIRDDVVLVEPYSGMPIG